MSRSFAALAAVFILSVALTAQNAQRFPAQVSFPLGLVDAPFPAGNPYSPEKAELGWYLYFDARLSGDNRVACATCHHPSMGWTDRAPVSTGIYGQKGLVSAPATVNRIYSTEQFWDGRATSLEEQVKSPIENPVEMGSSHKEAASKIGKVAGYGPLFEAAFGSPEVNIDRIAQAIATFERTLLSGNSAYDRYMAGDRTAMTPAQISGLNVFNGKARCAECHHGPNFTSDSYHNLGVGSDKEEPDVGRFAVTKKDEDWGTFKTPTLRDITKTAPYMHDGSEATLADVVEFYDEGGKENRNLDPRMKKLKLEEREERDLLAFLEALEGTSLRIATPASFPE